MLADAVRAFLRANDIEPRALVTGVSGGFDSTALLLVLVELKGFEITCAHINHHLRGEESDGDERYVRELCEQLKVPLIVADGTLDPERIREVGVEAAAREVRTERLKEIREGVGARYVATAHQKNDQAETVLMRLFTGSGLSGLRGIRAVREDGFIRPLLAVTRAEIESFLRERGETPRADRMNSDPRFFRTRVRKTLSEFEPFVTENLAAIAESAQARWPEIVLAVDAVEDVEATDDETRFRSLPSEPWLRRALLHRHIRRLDPEARDVSREDLERIERQLDTLARMTVTKRLELVRVGVAPAILPARSGREDAGGIPSTPLRAGAGATQKQQLVLRRIPHAASAFEYEIGAGEEVHIPEIAATLAVATRQPDHPATFAKQPGNRQPATGNSATFSLPPGSAPTFTIRNRRTGDRFHPLGAPGSKKLKDFLIDRKVPVERRDRIPLLVWNGEIVWVAGVEISERFKVTDDGGDLYVATLHYAEK
jgi:tRNA(Ile)-lysidine synthase